MHGAELYLVYGALILFAIGRQFLPQPVKEGRWWIVPAIMVGYGVYQMSQQPLPGLAASLALVADVAVSVVFGLLRGLTTRVWVAADGQVMKRGTLLTLACWVASFAARFGVLALFHAGFQSAGLLIFIGLSLGIQPASCSSRARGA